MAIRPKQFTIPIALLSILSMGFYAFGQDEVNLQGSLNKPYVTAEMITLPIEGDYESYKLTVKGPNNFFYEMEFSGENVPFVDSYGPYGEVLKNGQYSFRLELMPKISADMKEALRFARVSGDMSEVDAMRKAGNMTETPEPLYGYFTIIDGNILVPDKIEGNVSAKNEGRNSGDKPGDPVGGEEEIIGDVGLIDADGGIRDQVILDDLIVDGSACIGFDCVNGESFGFDTIRLKENNLRIKFMDTSLNNFPSNDWQLTANDSANGGANKFSIDDIDGGRTPFTIEARAPSHSLYVDDGGRLGLGTSIPVADVHVVSGNSPTLRLEQNGSSGFAPQTWDVAGNETNFFIRDASNGSQLPYRIRPSAPTNSIYVDSDGDVGLGTASPDSALDVDGGSTATTLTVQSSDATTLNVKSSGDVPQVLTQYTGAASARREMFVLENYGEPTFRFSNTDPGQADDWSMILLNGDSFLISRNGSGAEEMRIFNGGNVTIGGTLTQGSDVNIKENFEEVDPIEVLDQVAEMPITTWNYIRDEDTVRHMGPMAQDFASTFGLGEFTTGISSVDIDGVMLAAIKGLNQRLNEKEADLTEKDETIDQLQKRLADLERMVKAIAEKSE